MIHQSSIYPVLIPSRALLIVHYPDQPTLEGSDLVHWGCDAENYLSLFVSAFGFLFVVVLVVSWTLTVILHLP